MATLNAYGQLTLIELAKRKDPSGNLATIVEVLAEQNDLFTDAIWIEANDTFSHKTVRRLSEPAGTRRQINAGITREASRTVEVIETIGNLEAQSETDVDLIDHAPNPKQARMDEAVAFLNGLGKTVTADFFYGNSGTTPLQMHGLAPRLASLSATTNVIGCGGTGSDLTSMFIVCWGRNQVHMLYPKGDPYAGIRHTDKGEQRVTDAANNPYWAYVDHFKIMPGLCVRNERSIARLANIEWGSETSNLFDEDQAITLLNRMVKAGGSPVIYVHTELKTQMEILLKDKANVNFTVAQGLGGVPVLQFRGVPVRVCEQIQLDEDALV